MNDYLTRQQWAQLLAPIREQRVSRNRDGKSHVEAYEIRAHLNRVFGFGRWSGDVLSCDLVFEEPRQVGKQKDQPGVAVCYRVVYRLTVCAPDGTVLATYTEAATGDGVMGVASRSDAHDFAVKTAESQALKRCATNLGDQFGLSLYNKGSLMPLVHGTLVAPPEEPAGEQQTAPPAEETPDVDAHITSPLAAEDTPAQEADTDVEVSTPPPTDTPPGQAAQDPSLVADIRERALAATKKADVMRLITEATKAKVTGSMTSDANGRGMTLETFLMARVKEVAG